MLGDYKIEVKEIDLTEREQLVKLEHFTDSEQYSMRLAELIIRISQKSGQNWHRIVCYKNNKPIKCIIIEDIGAK